ncbi:MAG TPA: hypothetical protein ENI23_08100 [bacterium]|nr:hypothetical protein [bacterium]
MSLTYLQTLMDGKHGVDVSKVLPLLDRFEGLNQVEFPSSECKFRYDANKLQMWMKAGDTEYEVGPDGYKKAMRIAGFAESVIKKYPRTIMMDPLNWGFREKMKNVRAFAKGKKLIAFVKPTVELVSTRNLVNICSRVCGENAVFERLDHDMSFTNCSIIVGDRFREWEDSRLKQNDVVCGGINWQNSLMGEVPMIVSVYAYRLVCSNGMISADQSFKWSRNTETIPMEEWFEERVTEGLNLITEELNKVDTLRNTLVDPKHRHDVIANVFSEFGLSDRIKHLVMERFLQEPPINMWDIVNAITNVANDEDISDNPLQVRRIQLVGGEIAAKASVCPTCYSVSRG